MDATLQYIPIMIVAFAAALGLTPVSRRIAMRLGVVDKPNVPRKTHRDHKPMMGGLAIWLGFSLAVLVFSPDEHLAELLAIVAGASLLAITGLLDDRFNLSWEVRFGIMTIAALIVILAGLSFRLTGLPLFDIPITIIWVVALTNAVNFLDNMDGLSAGLSAIAAGFFLLLALTSGQWVVSMLAAGIFGAALGFLAYNFNPASTFMGDMGALVLGFSLAILGIKSEFGVEPLDITWLSPVLILALPIFDINLVVWTRLFEGRSPMEGGRDHTSHRIMALGFSPRATLFILYGACMLYGAIGLGLRAADPAIATPVGLAALATLVALFAFMVWVRQTRQKTPASTAQA